MYSYRSAESIIRYTHLQLATGARHAICKLTAHAWYKLINTGLNQPFSCPECRTDATLPENCLLCQPYDGGSLQVHGKVEAKCEMCSGPKAEAFCRQCVQFICEKCVESHKRMKVFVGHKISSLDEGGAETAVYMVHAGVSTPGM